MFGAALLAMLAACAQTITGERAQPGTNPAPRANIVFILADDLDLQLYADTPGLSDLLDREGATFTHNFVSLPLCCPSRTSILRGQFAHNTGVMTNQAPEGGFAKVHASGLERSTVATWLQSAGYRTALIGKYLNGYGLRDSALFVPPGWDAWFSPNAGKPFRQFGYSMNENGKTVPYGRTPQDYNTDVLATKADAFIRSSAGQPFFLYLAPYTPHGPATPAPRHAQDAALKAKFSGVDLGASFNEEDLSDKPAWVRALPIQGPEWVAEARRKQARRRLAMLSVVDLVKTVIAALEATSQAQNTYIFFASDNGLHIGQHRLPGGKDTAYEEDIHVPLAVRGPGVPKGSRIDALVANVDFAPTFAEIAGAPVPDFVDGRSFLPLLRGERPAAWRQVLLLEHGGDGSVPAGDDDGLEEPPDEGRNAGKVRAPGFAGLRTRTHSYVEYETGERELYDLARDPHQLDNAYTSADSTLRQALSARLAALRGAGGAGLRQAEQPPLP